MPPGGIAMPIHDWTRVPSGLFHEFHQSWTVRLKDALNEGRMPEGYYAMVEQKTAGPEPDVIAVQTSGGVKAPPAIRSGVGLAEPRSTRIVQAIESDAIRYARKANRITIRHYLGDVVAVIEIVSPGNKDSRNSLRSFVEKAEAFLRPGIHMLVVDLFPPTKRDPQGIHGAILGEIADLPFELPPDKPLTLVSYAARDPLTAYIEPVAVGDSLAEMPLYLTTDDHIRVPLEVTYAATFDATIRPIREMLVPPAE